MTPQQFIEKWRGNPLMERASYQLHFLDLCELVGAPKPGPQTADDYCFERGAQRTGAGQGWADVWMRGHFAIEYKATRRNLAEALKQLMTYALALDNPPLLVVCDTNIIEIHTHFTGAPSSVHTIALEDIGTYENQQKLRWLLTDPNRFHPGRTVAQITEEAAGKFAELAQALTGRGHDPQVVAHFLNQCLFCLFAEDVDLLPDGLFQKLLERSRKEPALLTDRLRQLFAAMQKGGDFALENIHWFNGGLFEHSQVLELSPAEIEMLYQASRLDWAEVDPSIFGTLFERGLDPAKRSQLGAHYTDQRSIMRIINPVIVEPLLEEWEAIKARLGALHPKFAMTGKKRDVPNKELREAYHLFHGFLEKLKDFKVLDPACGSGNFLYLALRSLKDLEHRVNLEAEVFGLHRQVTIECSPANVLGLELSPYAAELARVTIWIGELQWQLKNGYSIRRNPILEPLNHIENRDALLNPDGSEAAWPRADAIVGNPPFLGDKKMRTELGAAYTDRLRSCFAGRVPGSADFVAYWFEKSRAQIEAGLTARAGLVSTQSIRQGANQQVLGRITATTCIFCAWSDEPWVNEGAAVRVSLTCFGTGGVDVQLNGKPVPTIFCNLAGGSGVDVTQARVLAENVGVAFQGPVKVGSFDIPGTLAREWLKLPNPNGLPTSRVVRPWANGQAVTGRPTDTWIIDFGADMSVEDAALFELPYAFVLEHVKPMRDAGNREGRKRYWWRHGETVPALRHAVAPLSRYIATSRVAKHRVFVWLDVAVLPDSRLYVIACDDSATFGILSSRIHEVWSLANASMHGVGNDPTYNAKTCFEAFPFPLGLSPRRDAGSSVNPEQAAISDAAEQLDKLRNAWLNPPEWVDWEQTPEESAAGFPARPVPRVGFEADLKPRTVTNLYNARPGWLDNAHKALDQAVAQAYGWADYTPDMSDDEILRRLLALNLERAG